MGFLFGGGGSAPGYGNLTPDQSNMLQQQGWFPRADMVLPTGVANTQPTGYSGLTPAQSATVNSLGYYTPGGLPSDGGGGGGSLFDKLGKIPGLLDKAGFKGTNPADAQNAAADRAAAGLRAGAGRGGGDMLQQLQQMLGGHTISDLLYDPSLALQLLYRGSPPVGGMSQIGGQPGQTYAGRGRPG